MLHRLHPSFARTKFNRECVDACRGYEAEFCCVCARASSVGGSGGNCPWEGHLRSKGIIIGKSSPAKHSIPYNNNNNNNIRNPSVIDLAWVPPRPEAAYVQHTFSFYPPTCYLPVLLAS